MAYRVLNPVKSHLEHRDGKYISRHINQSHHKQFERQTRSKSECREEARLLVDAFYAAKLVAAVGDIEN